jgi:hypothetical protein
MGKGNKSYLSLDASIFDDARNVEALRLDVELNRIRFEFPSGFATIDLIEECRAINDLENFDLMYDITMQLLVEKQVVIYLKNYTWDNENELARFMVTDRYMNLRGVPIIDSYPIIVNWLTRMIGAHLSKKFPRPSVEGLAASLVKKQPVSSSMKKEEKQS